MTDPRDVVAGASPPGGAPAFAVVVPARDAADTLGACLDALAAQDVALPEVVVVDDGSVDGTRAVAEAWARAVDPARVARARVLGQPPRGAAAARNAGLAATTAPIVLFTDADCRPRPVWARALLAGLADTGASAAMGRLGSDQRALVARLAQAEYDEKQDGTARDGTLAFADTATAAFRADALRAVGGFDPSMEAVEDTELAFRLARAGHRIAYAPDAVVLHRHPEAWPAYARRKMRFGRWGARAYLDHPRRIAGDGRTPGAMRLQLAAGAVLVGASLAAALAGLAGLVAGALSGATPPIGPGGSAATAAARFGWVASGAAVVLGASSLPAAWRSVRRGDGAAVAAATPLLVVVRTGALLAGLVQGALDRAAGRGAAGAGDGAR